MDDDHASLARKPIGQEAPEGKDRETNTNSNEGMSDTTPSDSGTDMQLGITQSRHPPSNADPKSQQFEAAMPLQVTVISNSNRGGVETKLTDSHEIKYDFVERIRTTDDFIDKINNIVRQDQGKRWIMLSTEDLRRILAWRECNEGRSTDGKKQGTVYGCLLSLHYIFKIKYHNLYRTSVHE